MSANSTPDQKDYKNYKGFGSFKLFVLENFPFIEADFDALTYYQMLCKVVGYLQDVITNNESLQYNQTELLDAFNELQNYVNTYFDSLDIQTEINNKLDQMAESGELEEIIKQFLHNKYIFLGDSYGTGQNELGEQTNPWTNLVPQYLGLSQNQFITNCSNGSGFNHGKTFLVQLQEVANSIENKNEITDIVIIGGYNDRYHEVEEIKNAMSIFFKYAKSTFPFAKCKLACVGWSRVYDTRQSIANSSLNAYTQCGEYGCEYLKNTEFILHDYSLFSNDKYHPNQNGQNELSRYLADAIINGSCEIVRGFVTPTNAKTENVIQYNPAYILQTQHNDKITLMCDLDYITTNPVNIGNRTAVPLVRFTDGLIFGAGRPLLRQYMQVFTANSENQFIKLKGCYALQYSASDDSCILYFINQADNETHNNISAFNTDIIYLELPALYC